MFPADYPTALTQARAVIADPVAHPASPGALLIAWAMLKGQRGQTVNQLNLRRMLRAAAQPLPPLPVRLICPHRPDPCHPAPMGAA